METNQWNKSNEMKAFCKKEERKKRGKKENKKERKKERKKKI